MGEKIIFILKVLIINYCFSLWIGGPAEAGWLMNDMSFVHAQSQDIQYHYDSLGRISSARYPNGTEVKFEYDANGNLLYSEVIKAQNKPDSSEETGGNPGNTGEVGGNAGNGGSAGNTPAGNNQQGGGLAGGDAGNGGNAGSTPAGDNQQGGITGETGGGQGAEQESPSGYTLTDVQNYNQFKKSKPAIQSLKKTRSKKKYYLHVKIKQMNKRGAYGETQYQIKYATNSKFKKAKAIKVKRSKKGTITSKKWKVKKGKTYYVKVRAVMQTTTGKTIYSKYSKTKQLKVE